MMTYIRESKELKIDPSGTHEIFEMLEYLFLMLTKNARSVKYESNQSILTSQKPITFNFLIVHYGR